jgi:hypothetical protein
MRGSIVVVFVLEFAAEAQSLDSSLAATFDDGMGTGSAGLHKCLGQPLGMGDDPDLRPLGGARDHAGQRFEQLRMQARFGLVQRDECGQAVAEQRAGERELTQRAVRKLGGLEHALWIVGER